MSGSITGATGAATAGPAGGGTGARLSADMNTFLTLLTTQLRNQDPTQPMDANALTQQLVQFATVEQQLAGNRTLERLLSLQQASQLAGAAQLIGSRVTIGSDRLPLQDGRAEVVLPPAGRAARARIEIRDGAGQPVRVEDVTLGAGATRWSWDGTDARGRARPDGAYRLTVTGRAADGTAVPLDAAVTARVTGATRQDDTLLLRLGAVTAGFDRLRELPGAP